MEQIGSGICLGQDSQTLETCAGCDSASSSAGPSPAQQGTIGAVTQAPPGLSPIILIAALVMNSVTSESSFQTSATRGRSSDAEGESWVTFKEHERLFQSMCCLNTGLDSVPCSNACPCSRARLDRLV